jgi:hypothetical protein
MLILPPMAGAEGPKMKNLTRSMSSTIFATLLITTAAQSQITYEASTTSNGFMGMGAFTSTSRALVQGDSRREETQMQFTGSVMKHLSPKGTSVEIARLDKQLFWKFNDKDKKYTEVTFADYKQQFEEGKLTPPMPGQKEPTGGEEPQYEWQEPVVEVKNLGDPQPINGFPCDHYLVTVTTVGKHKATAKLDTLLFSADMFNSVSVGEAMKLISDFDVRLARGLGLDKVDDMAMAQAAAQYGEQISRLTAEMRKLQGYPIRTNMLFSMTTHAMAAQKPENATVEEEQKPAEVTDVKGALGGMFGRKIKGMAKPKPDKPKGESERKEVFQSTCEVTSIAAGDISADQFEVPAGYKLQRKADK